MAKPHICQKRKTSCFLGAIDQALYVGIKLYRQGVFMFYGHEGFYLKIHLETSGRKVQLGLSFVDLRSTRGLMLRSKAGDRSMHLGPRPDQFLYQIVDTCIFLIYFLILKYQQIFNQRPQAHLELNTKVYRDPYFPSCNIPTYNSQYLCFFFVYYIFLKYYWIFPL